MLWLEVELEDPGRSLGSNAVYSAFEVQAGAISSPGGSPQFRVPPGATTGYFVSLRGRAAGQEEQAMGWVGRLLIAMALPAMLAGPARAETPAMTAPPRQQGDVTAILDQQKPDPAATAKLRAEACLLYTSPSPRD